MATELQSINYITHHIERLPLNDNNFVGTAEKLPSLIYYHESLERNSKSYSKVNKNGVQIRDNSTNRSSFESRPGFNEHNKTWRDITHDNKPKRTQTIRDVVNKIDPILPNDSASACSKPHEEWSNLSTVNRNNDFTTNKRKRSSDSTGSDSSKSSCDEEIRRLGLCENRTFHSIPIQLQADFYRPCDNLADVSSPRYKKKPLCKSQPEQKRPKNRPSLDFESPKRRSSSTSWFPFRFRSGERKIKVIRVTPFDQRGPSIDNFYGEHLREDAFFRPIRVEEE